MPAIDIFKIPYIKSSEQSHDIIVYIYVFMISGWEKKWAKAHDRQPQRLSHGFPQGAHGSY